MPWSSKLTILAATFCIAATSVASAAQFEARLAHTNAPTHASHLGPDLILQALGLAPATKLLFATDASRRAEAYYLGARWWRESLAQALDRLVDSGHLTEQTALHWAKMVLLGNARRLYGL